MEGCGGTGYLFNEGLHEGRVGRMSFAGNGVEKKAFRASAGKISGFTMGNEFNSLSRVSVLCGTKFQEYPPFQDAPDDVGEELTAAVKNIGGNILGAIASFASVLGDLVKEKMFLMVCSGIVKQTVTDVGDMARLMKVVVGGGLAPPSLMAVRFAVAWAKSYIPHHISNEMFLGILHGEAKMEALVKQHQLMIWLPTVPSTPISIPTNIMTSYVVASHKTHNMEVLLKSIEENNKGGNGFYASGEYIENQAEWGDVKFGVKDMSFSGCEIMATYNALKALGEPVSEQTVVDLIAMYEEDGAVLGGLLGSSPYAIEDYFREQGYDVVTTTSHNPKTINQIGESSDTVIVNAYNNRDDITSQIHTVSITKEADGTYAVHNGYYIPQNEYIVNDGFGTLQEAIDAIGNVNNSSSIDVIGISK